MLVGCHEKRAELDGEPFSLSSAPYYHPAQAVGTERKRSQIKPAFTEGHGGPESSNTAT